MQHSRIDQMFSGGSRTEFHRESIVAHCICLAVDVKKETISACFASQPDRIIEISISPAMRADMNSHNRFRGNLIDQHAKQAMPAGIHFIAEGLSSVGGQRFQARWINLVPHPEKLHKGIITSSRSRFPGSAQYERTLLPFSYQKWADQAVLVTDESLNNLAANIEAQRQRWFAHDKRHANSHNIHPLSWLGVRYRAINEHNVVMAASPTLFALPDEQLARLAPPRGEDVRQLHRLFADKVREKYGNLTIEALLFQEFYASMHLKRPNHFLMPILLDGRAPLGIEGTDGKPLLDEEAARCMAVERGFLRLGQQNRDGGGFDDEGFVDDFFGYGLMPVHTAIKTHDGNTAKMQESLLPTEVSNEHTQYWLNQVRNAPLLFDSDAARYMRDHPYVDLPVHEVMMDRMKIDDDLAYRFYEMTNKAVRLSAHPQTVELLQSMEHYFAEGNKTMEHIRTYYQLAQGQAVRNGNAAAFNDSLVQLWLEFSTNGFEAPHTWNQDTTFPAKKTQTRSTRAPAAEIDHPHLPAPSSVNAQPSRQPSAHMPTIEEIGIQRMKGKLAPNQG